VTEETWELVTGFQSCGSTFVCDKSVCLVEPDSELIPDPVAWRFGRLGQVSREPVGRPEESSPWREISKLRRGASKTKLAD
jgi:hypothetical protein